MNSEAIQRKAVNEFFPFYDAHFSDRYSQLYRRRFWFEHLVRDTNLKNKKVLEAMCGSGQMTEYLGYLGAKVVGLDISDKAINVFRERHPEAKARRASILKSGFKNSSFDCVIAIGGLHHLHPHLRRAVREIYRILKPGGYFCFVEPHAGSWADAMRKRWYRHDKYFASNENSLDLESLKNQFRKHFSFRQEKYGGGLAYLLVPNSFAFRMPRIIKAFYSPILIFFEKVFAPLYTKKTACYVICQWQKIK